MKFTLSKLAKHQKSDNHTRRGQLRRAFELAARSTADVPCGFPRCDRVFRKYAAFFTHVEVMHPEQLWEPERAHELTGGDLGDATHHAEANEDDDEILF